jgi:hypothetical protein
MGQLSAHDAKGDRHANNTHCGSRRQRHGAVVVLSPKPAFSLPAAAALKHAQPDAGIAHEVKKYRYRYWGGRPYYRGYYGYRPYYRPYYYRPYYYGYGYPYWRRPGFSIWFGF